jgi:type I restriction enzyme, S subunit
MIRQIQNVPTLRFPEFKAEWNETSLDNFLILTLREVNKPDKPYLAIGIRSHCKGTFQKPNSDPEKIAMDKLYMVKENDLIVNITFAWEGAIAIVKKEDDGGLVSHRFPTYTFNENVSSCSFFQYVFVQKKFRTILDLISPGGAGRNRVLSKKDFLKIKVKLPTIPEQQKIAAFLTAIDEKIQQLAKKKDLLEQYKKGVMQKIFNQEIRFKDDNGNDFADWEGKKIEPYLKLYVEKVKANTDIPILTSSRNGLFMQKDYFDNRELSNEGEYGVVPRGYFTYRHMSDDSTFKFNINNICDKGAVSKEYPVFTTQSLDSVFLQLKLNHGDEFKTFAIIQKRGGTRTRLYFNRLTQLVISMPTLPEQQKIANFISAIDEKINLVNQQLEKTKEYKKSLLQKMFI